MTSRTDRMTDRTPDRTADDSGFSKSQKSYIRAEITAQLIAVKKQIDVEIAEDIKNLEARLLSAVTSAIGDSERKTAETVKKDVDTKVAAAKNQIVLANNNQLATVQETTKQLVQAVGNKIASAVHKRVIDEINRDIVPKVNSMVEYVSYQMQDPGEIVTDYRRAVERQAHGDTKLLTDGNDSHIISEHVSMFFREDD